MTKTLLTTEQDFINTRKPARSQTMKSIVLQHFTNFYLALQSFTFQ